MAGAINLKKDEVIVFLGGMNAMPMVYAVELRRLGYEVIYFVDVPSKNLLSRPENHFPEISYPYPDWVVEMILPSQIFLPLIPRFFVMLYMRKIKKMTGKKISCFMLNGFFSSLSPYLYRTSKKVALTHGSDLDVWGDIDGVDGLVSGFKRKSIFRYLPSVFSRVLIGKIINAQYFGYGKSDVVVYFPKGLSSSGDRVVEKLVKEGACYIPRYDISFEPLKGVSRELKATSSIVNIFCGVRFLFKSFSSSNKGENKGNDIIIEGLSKYYSVNKNIRIHFVEKGPDVELAKDLCRRLHLEDAVVWHGEMKFKELLALYEMSDICFDQVGEHWVGAIGGYAMWLGKPLIANVDSAVTSGVWPPDNPVCSAKSSSEIFEWLVKLEDEELRQQISVRSKKFVEDYMAPGLVLNKVFKFLD